jgi:hypothetical protein
MGSFGLINFPTKTGFWTRNLRKSKLILFRTFSKLVLGVAGLVLKEQQQSKIHCCCSSAALRQILFQRYYCRNYNTPHARQQSNRIYLQTPFVVRVGFGLAVRSESLLQAEKLRLVLRM